MHEFDQELITTGLMCPEPVMLSQQRLRKLAKGQVLKLWATDPATQRDIPKLCEFRGHNLLATSEEEKDGQAHFVFWVVKG